MISLSSSSSSSSSSLSSSSSSSLSSSSISFLFFLTGHVFHSCFFLSRHIYRNGSFQVKKKWLNNETWCSIISVFSVISELFCKMYMYGTNSFNPQIVKQTNLYRDKSHRLSWECETHSGVFLLVFCLFVCLFFVCLFVFYSASITRKYTLLKTWSLHACRHVSFYILTILSRFSCI